MSGVAAFRAVWNPRQPTQLRARHSGAAVFGTSRQSTWRITTPRPSTGDQRFSLTHYLTSIEDISGPGELLPQVHSQVCCYPDITERTIEDYGNQLPSTTRDSTCYYCFQ